MEGRRAEWRTGIKQLYIDIAFSCLIGEDDEPLAAANERLQACEIPAKFVAKKFIIGGSETGQPGTYHVIRSVIGKER